MTVSTSVVISERIDGVLTCVIPSAGGCIVLVGDGPEYSLCPLTTIPTRYELELFVAIHKQMWNARKGRQ